MLPSSPIEAEDLAMLQRLLDEHCAQHGNDETSRKMAAKALLQFFQTGHTDPATLTRLLVEWRDQLRSRDEA